MIRSALCKHVKVKAFLIGKTYLSKLWIAKGSMR